MVLRPFMERCTAHSGRGFRKNKIWTLKRLTVLGSTMYPMSSRAARVSFDMDTWPLGLYHFRCIHGRQVRHSRNGRKRIDQYSCRRVCWVRPYTPIHGCPGAFQGSNTESCGTHSAVEKNQRERGVRRMTLGIYFQCIQECARRSRCVFNDGWYRHKHHARRTCSWKVPLLFSSPGIASKSKCTHSPVSPARRSESPT